MVITVAYPLITAVDRRSPAGRAGVRPGMRLKAINGHPVGDVLDYRFYGYDSTLVLTLVDKDGRERETGLSHAAGGELGISFDTALMDKPKRCGNKCVFCFIDQQPPGLRESLYFKDDDARLSFLMGNYITLTNLTAQDIARIIEQRISPIRISVQASDPELRCVMLGNPRAGACMETMRRFADAGIEMHCQIVVCPGLNDGQALTGTLEFLSSLGDPVQSVSVVPAGLTRYRDGLYPLRAMTAETARDCIERASRFERVYCSDEMFITAGLPLPGDSYYGDYPQLENGVGMTRMFIDEFNDCARERTGLQIADVTLATGVAFAPFLRELLKPFGAQDRVCEIKNDFWGHSITVAGLVTGRDLIAQLKGRQLGSRLLFPQTMLRHEGDLFLDDVSPAQVSRELGIPVQPVAGDGASLFYQLFGS